MYGVMVSASFLAGLIFFVAGLATALRAHHSGKSLMAASTGDVSMKRLAFLIVPVLVIAVGVRTQGRAVAWWMPLWFEYHTPVIIWTVIAACCGVVFGLMIGGAFLQERKDRWQFVIIALAVTGMFAVLQFRLVGPPLKEDWRPQVTPDGVVMQTTGYTCGAASGANIARQFGIAATEEEMVERMGITSGGASVAGIIYGMRELGFREKKIATPTQDPAAVPVPAILFIDHPATGPETHAVSLMAWDGSTAEVWDPLIGKRSLSREKLTAVWRGHAVTFSRD